MFLDFPSSCSRLWEGFDIPDGLTAIIAVENLPNVDYRVNGSGENEPGTNLIISVDWEF